MGYGVAVLGESITAGTVAGLALILAGSYLGAEGRLPWRRAPAAGGTAATAPAPRPGPPRPPAPPEPAAAAGRGHRARVS